MPAGKLESSARRWSFSFCFLCLSSLLTRTIRQNHCFFAELVFLHLSEKRWELLFVFCDVVMWLWVIQMLGLGLGLGSWRGCGVDVQCMAFLARLLLCISIDCVFVMSFAFGSFASIVSSRRRHRHTYYLVRPTQQHQRIHTRYTTERFFVSGHNSRIVASRYPLVSYILLLFRFNYISLRKAKSIIRGPLHCQCVVP